MLLFGLLLRDCRLAVLGAIIHVLLRVVDVFCEYPRAKSLRAGTWKPDRTDDPANRFTNWVEIAMFWMAVVLGLVNKDQSWNGYEVAAMLIIYSNLICYVLCGTIAREVGGIPLTMGYGGWTVRGGAGEIDAITSEEDRESDLATKPVTVLRNEDET